MRVAGSDFLALRKGVSCHHDRLPVALLSVERVPMIGEVAVVVCNSGVKHALVGAANATTNCGSNAKTQPRRLGVNALRAVDPAMLQGQRRQADHASIRIAPTTSWVKIIACCMATRRCAGEISRNLAISCFQSHESSRDLRSRTAHRNWTCWWKSRDCTRRFMARV